MQTKLKKCVVVCMLALGLATFFSCTNINEKDTGEAVLTEEQSLKLNPVTEPELETSTGFDEIKTETLYVASNISLDDDGKKDDYVDVIQLKYDVPGSDSLIIVRFVLNTGETLLELYPVEGSETEIRCRHAGVIENDKEAVILELCPYGSKECLVSILGLGISDGKKTICEYFSSDTTPTLKRIMGTDLFENEKMNESMVTGIAGLWETNTNKNGVGIVEFRYRTDNGEEKAGFFQFDRELRKWVSADNIPSKPLGNETGVVDDAREWDWIASAKNAKDDERYSGMLGQLNLDGIGEADDTAEYYQIDFEDDDPWSDDIITIVKLAMGNGLNYYRFIQNDVEFFCHARCQSIALTGERESVVLELINPTSNYGAESLFVFGVDDGGKLQNYLFINGETGPYVLSQILGFGQDETGKPYEAILRGKVEITEDSGLKLKYKNLMGEETQTAFYWDDKEGWVK